jgi:hypothetical protein
MMAFGVENVAVKSALMAAEFGLRAAAPDIAADLTRHVADLLDRAQAARAVRGDVAVEEVMGLVAGAFAAVRHAGAETIRQRAAHIAQLILDGLQPQPRSATPESAHPPRHAPPSQACHAPTSRVPAADGVEAQPALPGKEDHAVLVPAPGAMASSPAGWNTDRCRL